MDQQDMINAITAALQTPDANGEFANVILVFQAGLIAQLPLMTADKLQQICTILNINTGN